MEIGEGLHAGSCSVQWEQTDVDWGRLSSDFHDPEMRRAGSPGIAEDGLIVAVEICQVRGSRIGSEENRALVEGSLDAIAKAKAGLVASSDKNPPLFWCRAYWLDA